MRGTTARETPTDRGWEGRLSEEFQLPGESAPGTLVAGYQVEESLGAVGTAVVYRARDERLGSTVSWQIRSGRGPVPPAGRGARSGDGVRSAGMFC